MPPFLSGAIVVMGSIVTTVAFFGLMWKIVKPHLEGYIRSQIEPLQKKTNEIHRSTTVNGGKSDPPTLLDEVHELQGQVAQVAAQAKQLTVQAGANAERTAELADSVEDLRLIATDSRELSRETRDQFREHEEKGEQYLGKVRLVMKTQGIDIPDHRDSDD